jgi:hypothetical protein
LSATGCTKLRKVNVFIYLQLPATTVAGKYRFADSLKRPEVKGKKINLINWNGQKYRK